MLSWFRVAVAVAVFISVSVFRWMLIAGCLWGAFWPMLSPARALAQGAPAFWTAIPAAGPAARWDHTLAADPETGRLVLFGGRDANGAPFADTWLYSTADDAWEALPAPGPAARFGQAVTVDPAARALWLFGGQADGATFFNDVWKFDLDALTWTEATTGEARPSPRYGASAVLDDQGRLLISHGFTFEGRFDDTWPLDLQEAGPAWTEIVQDGIVPNARASHDAAVLDGVVYLFGGYGVNGPLADFWTLEAGSRPS